MSESNQVRGQVSETIEARPEVLNLTLSTQKPQTDDEPQRAKSLIDQTSACESESDCLNTELIFCRNGLFDADTYKDNRFIGNRYRHNIPLVERSDRRGKLRDGHLPNLKYLIGSCNLALAPSSYIKDESNLLKTIEFYNEHKSYNEWNYTCIPFIQDVVKTSNPKDNSLTDKPDLVNYSILTEASGLFVITLKKVDVKDVPDASVYHYISLWMHQFNQTDAIGCNDNKNNPLLTMIQRTPKGNIQLIYRAEYAIECLRTFGDILYPMQNKDDYSYGVTLKYGKESIKLHGSYGKNGKMYKRLDKINYGQKNIFLPELPKVAPLWFLEKIFRLLQNNNYNFTNVDKSLISKNKSSEAFKFDPIEGMSSVTKALYKDILNSPYIDIKKCCEIIDRTLFNNKINCSRIISVIYNIGGKTEYMFEVTEALIRKSPHYTDLMKKLVVPLYRSSMDISKLADYRSKFSLTMLIHFIKKSIPKKYYNKLARHLFEINNFDHQIPFYKYKDFHKYDFQKFDERMEILDYIRNCIRKIDGNSGKILYYLNGKKVKSNGEIVETIMVNSEYDLMTKFKEITILKAVKMPFLGKSGKTRKMVKGTLVEIEEFEGNKFMFLPSTLWDVTKRFLANNPNCCYSDITFIPVSPLTVGTRYIVNSLKTLQRFNTFEGFPVKHDKLLQVDHKVIEPVLNQINYMCSGNKSHFDYFIKWLAHIVQEPHVKNDVIMHIRTAEEGAGKSTFFDWFGENIMGDTYLRVNTMERITSEKNGLIGGKVLINIEEGEILANNFKVIDILKDLCTCKRTVIRKLYSEGIEVDSFSNFVVLTNRPNTIPLSVHDRRYFCLEFKKPFPSGRGLQRSESCRSFL